MADESASDGGPPGTSPLADYSAQADRLARYEWIGMLTAALGFFIPPVLALLAGYCAYRIRRDKPSTAATIGFIIVATIVFWILIYLFFFRGITSSGSP
jgi:lipopolysaccharide export LptBFGC system permease protein LptF